ncbi:MAG TPA: M48 family metallopeptidase, partial [Albitalea sp.]
EKALATLDMHWTQPSALPAPQQAQLRDAWSRALQSLPEDERLPHALVFRKSRVGANAFALPGGTIVMTDELVRRVGGDEAILVGVLGHELGHLRHRHGMRMLIQASALGAVVGVLVGDVSSLLASVPAWLGQASYSRQAEREADAEALGLLRAAGVSPLVMVTFFETMGAAAGAERASGEVPAVLSTHPPDAERIAFFRAAAQGR